MNRALENSKTSIAQVKAIHQKFLKDLAQLEKKYSNIYAELEHKVRLKEIAVLKEGIKAKTYERKTKKS